MNKEKIIVGLDIGTTKICAIVGKENEFGKLEVLGMGKAVSEGVIRGTVTNIQRTVNAINKALQEAEEQSGVGIGKVNVGIAGQHIQSTTQHGSVVSDNPDGEISVNDLNRLIQDMYKVVMPAGKEIIHVMPQAYKVDDSLDVKDPIGEAGIRLEADFHIITADTSAISNIQKSVKRSGVSSAGLEVDNLILEPIASSLSVLNEVDKEMGVALVDIGGGTTDVAVFYDGIIRHTAVIPYGGEILTRDIKEGCNVLPKEAEALKTRFGKAIASEAKANEIIAIPGLRNRAPKEISVRNLSNIIQARMEEIIEMVHNEIIRSGYKNRLGAGIMLTGGGSQLAHARQLFEYMTGLNTQIGYPNEHLGKGKIEEIKSPMYSTSVGLVLAGFKNLDDRDNNRTIADGNEDTLDSSESGFIKGITNRLNKKLNLKNLLIDSSLEEEDLEY